MWMDLYPNSRLTELAFMGQLLCAGHCPRGRSHGRDGRESSGASVYCGMSQTRTASHIWDFEVSSNHSKKKQMGEFRVYFI